MSDYIKPWHIPKLPIVVLDLKSNINVFDQMNIDGLYIYI